MRIIYIANHDQLRGNDDEGAITHALQQLGHEVERVRESRGFRAVKMARSTDLVLFHKWMDVESLKAIQGYKVFWYFDLVEWPDPTVAGRNSTRINWMKEVLPVTNLGFCTDGDWVDRVNALTVSVLGMSIHVNKLVWLPQGADERVTGFGDASNVPNREATPPILFTGIRRGGGKGRADFVDHMQVCYRESFNHVQGVHGRALADLIAASKIVVAPSSPVTHKYWSNRVYMALGFGAFMLHPYCERLTQHYDGGKEILYYHDMDELEHLIHLYYNDSREEERRLIQAEALRRTLAEHTYRHRCEQLLKTVEQRLGAKL